MGKNVTALLSSAFAALKRHRTPESSEGGAPTTALKPKLYCDPFWNGFGSSFEGQTEFLGDPNGEPYVVQISGSHWIPVSVLVFAASEEDAKERVTTGIRRTHSKRDEQEGWDRNRAKGIIELIEQGQVKAEKFDKRCLAKAIWAGNDYLA